MVRLAEVREVGARQAASLPSEGARSPHMLLDCEVRLPRRGVSVYFFTTPSGNTWRPHVSLAMMAKDTYSAVAAQIIPSQPAIFSQVSSCAPVARRKDRLDCRARLARRSGSTQGAGKMPRPCA